MDCLYIETTSARSYLSASSYFVKAYPKTLLIILTLISFQTLGQNYEEMSSDVQFKMDQNKIEGKEILNEIFIDYEFSFGGINTATDKDNLLRVLSEKFNATDINFNSENGHVRFTSPAKNDMDLLKSSLVEVNIGLNNIFRKEYIVSKQ
jgi:hypothetical protein